MIVNVVKNTKRSIIPSTISRDPHDHLSEVDQAGIDGLVGMINAVSPQRTVRATDLRYVHNPPPAPVMRVILTHSDLRD